MSVSFGRTSILAGIDVGKLRLRLASMQQAYLDLTTGGKVQSASYAQGDGAKQVSYTVANLADLTQAILAVQNQIDALTGQSINRRPPLRPYF